MLIAIAVFSLIIAAAYVTGAVKLFSTTSRRVPAVSNYRRVRTPEGHYRHQSDETWVKVKKILDNDKGDILPFLYAEGHDQYTWDYTYTNDGFYSTITLMVVAIDYNFPIVEKATIGVGNMPLQGVLNDIHREAVGLADYVQQWDHEQNVTAQKNARAEEGGDCDRDNCINNIADCDGHFSDNAGGSDDDCPPTEELPVIDPSLLRKMSDSTKV